MDEDDDEATIDEQEQHDQVKFNILNIFRALKALSNIYLLNKVFYL